MKAQLRAMPSATPCTMVVSVDEPGEVYRRPFFVSFFCQSPSVFYVLYIQVMQNQNEVFL